uniref:RRM domain-containing protein n=1 Tax=Plectus sambesii TaxID=2011161 RepID=A0A914XRB1_9BILA
MELVKDKSGAKKRKEKKKAKKAAYVLKSKLKKTKANAAKEISNKKKRGNATADKSSEVLPVVNEFRVLRVAVDAKRNTVRHWFLKKHESENEKSTVVVAGIPPYVSKDCLERIFCEFGDVKDVVFQRAVDDSLFESSTEKVSYVGN